MSLQFIVIVRNPFTVPYKRRFVLDQVVLAGPGDIGVIPIHIIADHLHNHFVKRTFYILPKSLIDSEKLRCLFIDIDDELLKNVIFWDEEKILSPSVCSNKWIYQQLLKI